MRALPFVALAFEMAALTASSPGRAQSGDKVTAEALFEDGRRLALEGKLSEACPKFADSERLDPSPATLLNLASCWERSGRTATAWATYREAASLANAAGRKDYVAVAQRHADALGPKLSRLVINVSEVPEGLEIKRDGILLERAAWATALPVDPGTHSIQATAPERKPWTAAVEVPASATTPVAILVPTLDAAPAEPAPAASGAVTSPPASSATSSSEPAASPEADANAGSGQRTAGWVAGGLGVVGLGLAATFAVIAKSKDNDSSNSCHDNLCSQAGLSERNSAQNFGDMATVAFGVGAAAVAAGAVLWLTAPHSESGSRASLELVPTGAGALLKGRF